MYITQKITFTVVLRVIFPFIKTLQEQRKGKNIRAEGTFLSEQILRYRCMWNVIHDHL